MQLLSVQRILISLGMIVFVGAVAAGATGAFFNDTETSTGNTFAAGDIDLQIDNDSYITATSTQGSGPDNMVAWAATSWDLTDLTIEKFFDFIDLKPGDLGEDTISIHVGSNNAWLCAAAQVTTDEDNTCTEPEGDDDANCAEPGPGLGELDEQVNFAFWVDDGDNVFEPVAGTGGSPETVFLSGPISGLDSQGQIALSDASGGPFGSAGVPGGSTNYIGKAWCFGAMTPDALVQDGVNTGNPTTLGTGWNCDGTGVDNAAQTDRVIGDLEFYAEQSRNNADFQCETDYVPSWVTPVPAS
ncbi:MAG: hypothetical protein G01um10148_752 [Parcubacteria group bacterium Gr01-1014_8]|nr:MAG: hypothetical protein G01um10148_752 [Parcubacteria group bacterium Gr01-1014_8]